MRDLTTPTPNSVLLRTDVVALHSALLSIMGIVDTIFTIKELPTAAKVELLQMQEMARRAVFVSKEYQEDNELAILAGGAPPK